MPPSLSSAWICPICGYVHYGSEPPDECPVCGAAKEMFEPYTETASGQSAPASTAVEAVVIAGAGIAGLSAAEALRKNAPQTEITLISAEAPLPYYRLDLTRSSPVEIGADQLGLHPESWYAENRIQLLRQTELRALDLDKKELTFTDGSRKAYTKLILTIGANPFRPPIAGADRKNVTTLRTRADADFILAACAGNKKCVCIGGGLLGLETAGALACRGVEVTVLENQGWLLPRQLTETASQLFLAQVQALGLTVRIGAKTRELVGDENVRGVLLEDGALVPADVVVISAGVRSNTTLAREAGLEVRQGIIVDDQMRTSHADVWAAGDVAEHREALYGLWNPARLQGAIAGKNAAGQAVDFAPLPRATTLKVLGIDLFSLGRISPEGPADKLIEGRIAGNHYGFVFRDRHLIGSILLGDAGLSAKAQKTVETLYDCSAVLNKNPGVKDILEFLETIV